jgi:hypothetical protein
LDIFSNKSIPKKNLRPDGTLDDLIKEMSQQNAHKTFAESEADLKK